MFEFIPVLHPVPCYQNRWVRSLFSINILNIYFPKQHVRKSGLSKHSAQFLEALINKKQVVVNEWASVHTSTESTDVLSLSFDWKHTWNILAKRIMRQKHIQRVFSFLPDKPYGTRRTVRCRWHKADGIVHTKPWSGPLKAMESGERDSPPGEPKRGAPSCRPPRGSTKQNQKSNTNPQNMMFFFHCQFFCLIICLVLFIMVVPGNEGICTHISKSCIECTKSFFWTVSVVGFSVVFKQVVCNLL